MEGPKRSKEKKEKKNLKTFPRLNTARYTTVHVAAPLSRESQSSKEKTQSTKSACACFVWLKLVRNNFHVFYFLASADRIFGTREPGRIYKFKWAWFVWYQCIVSKSSKWAAAISPRQLASPTMISFSCPAFSTLKFATWTKMKLCKLSKQSTQFCLWRIVTQVGQVSVVSELPFLGTSRNVLCAVTVFSVMGNFDRTDHW